MGEHRDRIVAIRARTGERRICTHPRKRQLQARAAIRQDCYSQPGIPSAVEREHDRGYHTRCEHTR